MNQFFWNTQFTHINLNILNTQRYNNKNSRPKALYKALRNKKA